MSDVLHVHERSGRGTRFATKLRQTGKIPAVLYGHGQETVCLSVETHELQTHLRHRARVFELQGAAEGSVLLRDVQYDPLGAHILHIDLARVSADEVVDVTLSIHLRGDAPGTHQGGIVEHVTHEIEIRCPVNRIPEELEVNVGQLQLGKAITAGEVPLPVGATLVTPADVIIVSCHLPSAAPAVEPLVGPEQEPEIVGRAAQAKTDEED